MENERELELSRNSLVALTLDSNIVLFFGQSREYELRIEVDFVLTAMDTEQVVVQFDPFAEPSPTVNGIDDLAALVGTVVRHGSVATSGIMIVEFESGVSLVVRPSSSFESWTFSGSGELLVSTAGGKLAVF